jgi:hypothetical protein
MPRLLLIRNEGVFMPKIRRKILNSTPESESYKLRKDRHVLKSKRIKEEAINRILKVESLEELDSMLLEGDKIFK